MEITKPCLSPYHPFKQKTYTYRGWENESQNYCSSCNHFQTVVKMFFSAALMPMPTLYGDKLIELNREQAQDILDQVFDERVK